MLKEYESIMIISGEAAEKIISGEVKCMIMHRVSADGFTENTDIRTPLAGHAGRSGDRGYPGRSIVWNQGILWFQCSFAISDLGFAGYGICRHTGI